MINENFKLRESDTEPKTEAKLSLTTKGSVKEILTSLFPPSHSHYLVKREGKDGRRNPKSVHIKFYNKEDYGSQIPYIKVLLRSVVSRLT